MSHLTGQWELQQLAAAGPNSPPTTRVTYSFEMWPKGRCTVHSASCACGFGSGVSACFCAGVLLVFSLFHESWYSSDTNRLMEAVECRMRHKS
jgi:hypothetical protein